MDDHLRFGDDIPTSLLLSYIESEFKQTASFPKHKSIATILKKNIGCMVQHDKQRALLGFPGKRERSICIGTTHVDTRIWWNEHVGRPKFDFEKPRTDRCNRCRGWYGVSDVEADKIGQCQTCRSIPPGYTVTPWKITVWGTFNNVIEWTCIFSISHTWHTSKMFCARRVRAVSIKNSRTFDHSDPPCTLRTPYLLFFLILKQKYVLEKK